MLFKFPQKIDFERKVEDLLKKLSDMKIQLSDLQKEIEVREEEVAAAENINVQLKNQIEEYQQAEQHYKNLTEVSYFIHYC